MKLISSLFWQLYLSIIGALFLVGVLFVGTSIYYDQTTAIDHFNADVTVTSQPILEQWKKERIIDPEFLEVLATEHFFHIRIVSTEEVNHATNGFDFIADRGDVRVFEGEDGLLLSLQPLPNSEKWLIVADIDHEAEARPELPDEILMAMEREAEEDAAALRVFQFTLAGALLLLAIILLLQVRKISGHIRRLIDTSIDWGRGDLHKRADETAPRPLNELAGSLNQMAQNLHQSNKEQQVMVHAVSHELRTPLSKLELALSLLQRQHAIPDDDPLIENLSSYMDELGELASQVLTYSKLRHRSAHKTYEKVDVSLLVQERCQQLGKLHNSKEIVLDVESNINTRGEAFYLQLLIDNIVANALKFAARTVKVTLHETDQCLTFKVSDDGPGISPEMREQVFVPFFRVDESRTRDTGGFGLGLSMVDTLVQQHKGTIELGDSRLGGLVVTITLPK